MSQGKVLYIPGFMGKVDESSFLDDLEYDVVTFDLLNADVESIPEKLKETIESVRPDFIYAYSMGGRILLSIYEELSHKPKKVFLESVGLQIPNADKKKARNKLDNKRARQIKDDFTGFLQTWYFMPMWNFSGNQKDRMIQERQVNYTYADKFAQLIVNYSPSQFPTEGAKAPLDILKENEGIFYIVGAKDANYRKMAKVLKGQEVFKQRVFEVNDAGHNIHFQKPDEIITLIENIIGQ